MSKQSEAKINQQYIAKAIPNTCGNCVNFKSEIKQVRGPTYGNPEGWFEEKNLRCEIGGFAVKKMGTCNIFKMK